MNLTNTDGEQGRVLGVWVLRRLSLDAYRWRERRWRFWSAWDVGVLLNVRAGQFECQVRWR